MQARPPPRLLGSMTNLAQNIAAVFAPGRERRGRLGLAWTTIARLGGVTLAVLIVGAYFSIRTDGQLLIGTNILTILRGLSTIAIMGFGLTVVIIAAEIDLSFAAVYGLSTNIVAVLWLTHGELVKPWPKLRVQRVAPSLMCAPCTVVCPSGTCDATCPTAICSRPWGPTRSSTPACTSSTTCCAT